MNDSPHSVTTGPPSVLSSSESVNPSRFLALVWVTLAAPVGAQELLSESIEHRGRQRSYLLHVPQSAPAEQRLPLVLVLHGAGGDGARLVKSTGFTALAAPKGFLVSFP